MDLLENHPKFSKNKNVPGEFSSSFNVNGVGGS